LQRRGRGSQLREEPPARGGADLRPLHASRTGIRASRKGLIWRNRSGGAALHRTFASSPLRGEDRGEGAVACVEIDSKRSSGPASKPSCPLIRPFGPPRTESGAGAAARRG